MYKHDKQGGETGMGVTRGGPGHFGNLTGFPKTGVEMKWMKKDNGRVIQRGDYRGPVTGNRAGAGKGAGDWWNTPDWFQFPFSSMNPW